MRRAAPFVAVVNVETGREVLRRKDPDEACLALGFSGDGRRLAAAGVARDVLVWDLEAGGPPVESRQGPPGAMDLAFSPDGTRLAVASRQQVKLMDAATAEEVLALRGRAQLVSNTHGFNPRVRFRPDGRSLLAICDDTWDKLAEWLITGDTAGEAEARLRVVRRRAVGRHLAVADHLVRKGEPTWRRRPALDHLEQAARIGLESPWELLWSAEILALLDLPGRADEDVERAVALAPGDDAIAARAALIHGGRGRFREAARWYARMSSQPSALFCSDSLWHAQALVLAGEHDRYRWLCEESVRRSEAEGWPQPRDVPEIITLEPVPTIDAGELVRIARRRYETRPVGHGARQPMWAAMDLGTAYVRAGDPARAEAYFREAMALATAEAERIGGDGLLAIALCHRGQREEAKACFDRIDHFVRAPPGRPSRPRASPAGRVGRLALVAPHHHLARGPGGVHGRPVPGGPVRRRRWMTTMPTNRSDSASGRVLELAEEFLDRYRKGERPSLQEYTDRYPENADEIREVFPALAMLENIGVGETSSHAEKAHTDSPTKPTPPAVRQLGEFRILREIGHGGMGVVYEAEQVSLGRHVALKLLPAHLLRDPKQRRRFEREARAAARLQHANIVPVFGTGEHDGTPYYAMQFIPGHGLDEVLDELRRLKAGINAPEPVASCDSTGETDGAGQAQAPRLRSLARSGREVSRPRPGRPRRYLMRMVQARRLRLMAA